MTTGSLLWRGMIVGFFAGLLAFGLLKTTGEPAVDKAIAFESGYKKQRSFNKTFKSIYKLTPATYRRHHYQVAEAKL